MTDGTPGDEDAVEYIKSLTGNESQPVPLETSRFLYKYDLLSQKLCEFWVPIDKDSYDQMDAYAGMRGFLVGLSVAQVLDIEDLEIVFFLIDHLNNRQYLATIST